jgi:hypothetical protein
VLLVPLILVLAVIAWPLLVVWRRGRIRKSLDVGSPDQRVVGAWSYTRWASRRLGTPMADTVSPATYAADPNTAPRLASLAALAETAMYAPEQLDTAQATTSWQLSEHVTADAVRRASWARKLRWWLVPARGPR